MGIFKSRSGDNISVQPPKTAELENGNSIELDKNSTLILDTVNSVIGGGQQRGSQLVFSSFNLSVEVRISDNSKVREFFTSQLIFIVNNPYFDEPLTESLSGVGATFEEALKNGAVNFAESTLKPILQGLESKGETILKSEIMGVTRVFRKSSQNASMLAGCENKNMLDLWQLVREEIPLYLGTKKFYWIKLFTACSENKPVCEVRINGIVYPELTQKLFKYVKNWSDKQNYHMEKQFVFIVQDDENFVDCPFTKDFVMECTLKSIALLKQVDSAQKRNAAVNTIKAICKDDILALEICTFLPEIYTQAVLNLKESDGLTVVIGEDNFINLKKSQVRSYGYIEDTVKKYIHFEKPSKEDNMKIMYLSSKMNAVHKALTDGADLKNLIFPPCAFMASSDYIVR